MDPYKKAIRDAKKLLAQLEKCQTMNVALCEEFHFANIYGDIDTAIRQLKQGIRYQQILYEERQP